MKHKDYEKRRDRLTAVDLFAGAGGLSLGLQLAGFHTIGAVEIDHDAAETYRRNHAGVHLWNNDVRILTSAEVLRKLGLRKGELDLLAGCPPCQGFSTLRTKNSNRPARDPRNDLVSELMRFVRGLRPRAVMLENVPGLAKNARFRMLVQELHDQGYGVEFDVVNAMDYGVPQRRKRLVMVATRAGKVRLVRQGGARQTVRDAIGGLPTPSKSKDPLHNVTEGRKPRVMKMISRIPKDGGSRRDLPHGSQLACHKRTDGFGDVYGRMAWDAVAPTITSGCLNPSKGRFLHPIEDRAITPREAALLQGFPPNYWFSARRGKEHLALQIGNAFPPEMIRHIANPSALGLR